MSSPVISVSPPLNNSVINSPKLSLVSQLSSRSLHNNHGDNRCFNRKDSSLPINELSSPMITAPLPMNDSVMYPTQMYSVCQQSSISSQNIVHELQASSIPSWNSPDPLNTMSTTSSNKLSHNNYGRMVDVSRLTPAQLQQHDVILLQNYHELCNTNKPSSMFVSPTPIPNIESFSQSTILSFESG